MKLLIYIVVVGIMAVVTACSGAGGGKAVDVSLNEGTEVEEISFVNNTEGVVKIDSAYLENLTPEQKAKLDTLIKISEGVLDIEANSEAELIEKIESADIDSCRAFVELIKAMTKDGSKK